MKIEDEWKKAEEKADFTAYTTYINKYPKSKYSDQAEIKRKEIFENTEPDVPTIKINSNLSVDVKWNSVNGADSYKVVRSNEKNCILKNSNYQTVKDKTCTDWPNSLKNPVYYKIIAIRDSNDSKPSKIVFVSLKSSEGGKKCQICGEKSIGSCHLRGIYVCSSHDTFTSKEGKSWRCP